MSKEILKFLLKTFGLFAASTISCYITYLIYKHTQDPFTMWIGGCIATGVIMIVIRIFKFTDFIKKIELTEGEQDEKSNN